MTVATDRVTFTCELVPISMVAHRLHILIAGLSYKAAYHRCYRWVQKQDQAKRIAGEIVVPRDSAVRFIEGEYYE